MARRALMALEILARWPYVVDLINGHIANGPSE